MHTPENHARGEPPPAADDAGLGGPVHPARRLDRPPSRRHRPQLGRRAAEHPVARPDLRPAGGPARRGGCRGRPQQAPPRRRPRRGGEGVARPAAAARPGRAAFHHPRPVRGRDVARRRHPVRHRRRQRGSDRLFPACRLPLRAGPAAARRRGQPDGHRRPAGAGRGSGAGAAERLRTTLASIGDAVITTDTERPHHQP